MDIYVVKKGNMKYTAEDVMDIASNQITLKEAE